MGSWTPPTGDLPSDRTRALFLSSFSVMDIAEPLVSFDEEAPAPEVRVFLARRGWSLVGVRRDGLVEGYAFASDLSGSRLAEHLRPFVPEDLVPAGATLVDTIASLDANGRCFVSILGRPGGIVTFRDLEKPPVRMWLFGMITIFESFLSRRVLSEWPDGSWTQLLTASRRAKAEQVRVERARRGQPADLLDCIQLSDKASLLTRRAAFLEGMRFGSKRQADEAFQRVQALRNGLAHSQAELVSTDWALVVRLAHSVDRLALVA